MITSFETFFSHIFKLFFHQIVTKLGFIDNSIAYIGDRKNIENKQEEYFQNLFKQLEAMDSKLKEMDGMTNRLTSIEDKIEKYRPKTPQEKVELRSLDSGPFKQKLSDFFVDKQQEMEQSGKNEYVLTTDEVKQYSPNQIEDTFNQYGQDEDDMM